MAKLPKTRTRRSPPLDPPAPITVSLDDTDIFQLAPMSLWLEDYSALRDLFETWRAAGVTDLRAHLAVDPERVQRCSACLKVIKVNRKTLDLFEARDLDHLTANLHRVFRDDMLDCHIEELAALWRGECEFASRTVNYTLSGRRLDIQLRGRILPGRETRWDRVLVSIEDVSEREEALRRQSRSEAYAKGLFEHSPVSLWVEDFSAVKRLLDGLRGSGISDFRTFTDVHPEFIRQCMAEIVVLDINQHTLTLFGAPDKATLLNRLGDVFRDNMVTPFREQLVDLWNDTLFQQREVVNYALDGRELHCQMQFSVLPGHEDDWSLVQVALTDITARKKAEAYLEFLGRHDELTKLFNRAYFSEEISRLDRKKLAPVSVIVADLNGLKDANDRWGHAAGDKLLVRAGEVLREAVDPPATAARIGGDEFALLLPHSDERRAAALADAIRRLVELNNQYHPGARLSFALGIATRRPGETLEETVGRADMAMYEAKRAYHAGRPRSRRRAG